VVGLVVVVRAELRVMEALKVGLSLGRGVLALMMVTVGLLYMVHCLQLWLMDVEVVGGMVAELVIVAVVVLVDHLSLLDT